jgi:D-lactate dehydrogenase
MGEIAEKTDVKLIIPDGIEDTCCSTPFSSKGYENAGLGMFDKAIEVLYNASDIGKIPIVIDTSPCTYKFLHPSENISEEIRKKWKKLTFIDIIPFLNEITKSILIKPIDTKVVLHPTCSTHKMEQVDIMKELAERCATEVIIPQNSSCCGFAGDRGMIVPDLAKNSIELNKSSLTEEERKYNGYSSSRMCEIGVSEKEQMYSSIALLVLDYLNSN